jgi:hypothetical protein
MVTPMAQPMPTTPVIVLLPVLRSPVIVAARIIPELLHVNFNFPGIDSATLVATRSCPVATGAHSGCNLFTSGCN